MTELEAVLNQRIMVHQAVRHYTWRSLTLIGHICTEITKSFLAANAHEETVQLVVHIHQNHCQQSKLVSMS